jgi:hypothetical protein
MKKLFTILALISIAAAIYGQSPEKMSYQAVVRNSDGTLVRNSNVGVRIQILKNPESADRVLMETHSTKTNENGLVTIEIGGGTSEPGTFYNFADIDWSAGPYFLQTEIDPSGGTNYSIVGTTQLLSVPYALYAKSAETVSGGSIGLTHYIGELYQGGIVVAAWKQAGIEHGLITSLSDIMVADAFISAPWSNVTSNLIGATAQSPRDGQANTTAIIGQPGHNSSAALLCDEYTSGGYSDWYLPALWELNLCYNAATIVNEVLGDINGFQNTYWCSTESDNLTAYYQNFYNGYLLPNSKDVHCRVRAVRRF